MPERKFTPMPGEGPEVKEKLKKANIEVAKKEIAAMVEGMSAEEIQEEVNDLMKMLEEREREDGAGHA